MLANYFLGSKSRLLNILFISFTILFSISLGLSINNNLFIPLLAAITVIVLLIKPEIAYFIFILTIPVEYFLKDNFAIIIKGIGLLAFASFMLNALIKKYKFRIDVPFKSLLVFLAWAVISLLWSNDLNSSLQFLTSYSLLSILYFMIINQNDDRRAINYTLIALACGGVGLVISGIYQISQLVNSTADFERLFGATNDQNYYFMLSITLIPPLYWGIKHFSRTILMYIYFTTFISMLITDLYTKSRAGLVSFFIFALISVFLQKKKLPYLFFLGFLTLIIFINIPSGYLSRFATLGNEELDRVTLIWPSAINNFLRSPIIGYGIGNGGIQLLKTTSIPHYYNFSALSPHNVYLGISLDVGIIGLFFYLIFMIYPSYYLGKLIIKQRKYTIESNYYVLATLIFSAMITYMLYILQGGGMETRKILWVMAGVQVLLIRVLRSELTDVKNHVKST